MVISGCMSPGPSGPRNPRGKFTFSGTFCPSSCSANWVEWVHACAMQSEWPSSTFSEIHGTFNPLEPDFTYAPDIKNANGVNAPSGRKGHPPPLATPAQNAPPALLLNVNP